MTASTEPRSRRAPVESGISAWLNVSVRGWRLASLGVAFLVAAPILVVAAAWFTPATDIWRHIADTVLAELLRHTVVLVLGVGLGVLVLGTALAWLVATCEFPGRRYFDWALMLPLAIPAYVLAFLYVGLLDYSGQVQTGLRAAFGTDGLWFPPIRSGGGVITVMVLAFYPYVYMLARAAFLAHGRTALETGRVFGLSPWRAFWHASLPMARPALAAGVALAVMEALADFGAVAVFNYDTFTTAIYKAWQGLFSLSAAAQLSSLLLLFIAAALIAEQRLRGNARYDASLRAGREGRYRLRGWSRGGASGFAGPALLLTFIAALGQLLARVW